MDKCWSHRAGQTRAKTSSRNRLIVISISSVVDPRQRVRLRQGPGDLRIEANQHSVLDWFASTAKIPHHSPSASSVTRTHAE
jgi:hypothetical protein